MVTNFMHLGEGKVRLVLKNGPRHACALLQNDRRARVLRVEIGDGYFVQVPYEDVAYATVPLNQ